MVKGKKVWRETHTPTQARVDLDFHAALGNELGNHDVAERCLYRGHVSAMRDAV